MGLIDCIRRDRSGMVALLMAPIVRTMRSLRLSPRSPRTARRLPGLLMATTLLFLSTACSTPCRSLAEKLCDCETDTTSRETCLRGVAERAGTYDATEAQNQVCDGFLGSCDCKNLNTADGKRACGLAN